MGQKKRPIHLFEHHHTIWEEFLCHLPYAIFSVAMSMVGLSVLTLFGQEPKVLKLLFHNFHYLHILFAGTGVVLTFRRYSKNTIGALLVGISVPVVFCTLSDSVLPFLSGWYFALDMHFHWCFMEHIDKVLPFLFIGVLNGFVMSNHPASRQFFYSAGSHFIHILISSMASLLYVASFGFVAWHTKIGFVFLFLIVAVLLPCTLSDIVIPILFANSTSSFFRKIGFAYKPSKKEKSR